MLGLKAGGCGLQVGLLCDLRRSIRLVGRRETRLMSPPTNCAEPCVRMLSEEVQSGQIAV